MSEHDRYLAFVSGALLLALVVVVSMLGPCAKAAGSDPLPATLTLYAPPLLDPFDTTPGRPISANPDTGSSAPFPRAWLWPSGRFDLTGVAYGFWSPPIPTYGDWNRKSKRTLSVNYAGMISGAPAVGDSLGYVGFQDARMSLAFGVDDDSTVYLKRGFAVVTAATDSVVEFRAWLIVRANNWTRDDSLATFGRLVPETYRPGVLAGGQP